MKKYAIKGKKRCKKNPIILSIPIGGKEFYLF